MYEYIKILLVEDEAPLLGAMTLKLKKAGFTVLQGHNGKEGFDLAMKEFPNIIITDIVMPEMDGLQMIQNIRKDQKWGVSVPIILLTNLNDFNHVATAMEYGVHDYLVKSNWKLKDLLETVKNKLNLSHDATATSQPVPETTTDTPQTTPEQPQVSDPTVAQVEQDPNISGVSNTPIPNEPQAKPVDTTTPVTNIPIPVTPVVPPADGQTTIPTAPVTDTIPTDGTVPTTAPVTGAPVDPNNPNTPNPYYS